MPIQIIESYQLRNMYKKYSGLFYHYLQYPKLHPYSMLQQDAAVSTFEYIKKTMPKAVSFFSAKDLLIQGLSEASREGEFAEFGVYRAGSLNVIARQMKDKTIWGFDSFEGLPNNWLLPKGSFSLDGQLPKVRENVKLVKGLFSDTTPGWFNSVQKISFLHIDCDLFESANDVLDAFRNSRCFEQSVSSKGGVIIVFDDYFNQPFWQECSHKAFLLFLDSVKHVKVTYLAYAGKELGVRIYT